MSFFSTFNQKRRKTVSAKQIFAYTPILRSEPETPRSRFLPGAGASTVWVSSNSGSGFRQVFKNLKIVMKTQTGSIRRRMLICEFLLNF